MVQMGNDKYAFFDGDNIGSAIEQLLNSGNVQEATHLSESIKLAIYKIEQYTSKADGVDLIIAGGDDVLIRYDSKKYNVAFLEEIKSTFTRHTGLSMSCGVGDDVSQAIGNLTHVKQQSKGSIKQTSTSSELQEISIKSTKLYIFTTSDIADPYINVIMHCLVHQSPLIQVVLIGITDDRRKIDLQKDSLDALRKGILDQVDRLCQGKYLKRIDGKPTVVDIEVLEPDRQGYSRLKSVSIDIKPLVYDDLEKEIVKTLNDLDLCRGIFDVTAVLKSYLVDIYTILRFRNITSIYSFELFDKRTFDENELIHNLTFKKKYDYVCLSESAYTRERMIINEASVISEGDYNNLANAFGFLEKNRDFLEEQVATNFAKAGMLTYCFVGGLLIFLIKQYKGIVSPEGWSWLEPRLWLCGVIFLLIESLLLGLFTWSIPPLNPAKLYGLLKAWKKKQLIQRRLVENAK
jgi:hypothetical protein